MQGCTYTVQGDYNCPRKGGNNNVKEHFGYDRFNIVPIDNPNICVDIWGGAKNNYATAGTWWCHGGNNQKFVYNANNQLIDVNSGKCLDVNGYNMNNGGKVILFDCNRGDNQKWDLDPNNGIIKARHSQKCLHITGGVAPGREMMQWDCQGHRQEKLNLRST